MVDSHANTRRYRHTNAWRPGGSVRTKVLATTGGRCLFCGWPGDDGKGKGMTLAHRLPHDDGGADDETNLIPLCPSCHTSFDNGRRVTR